MTDTEFVALARMVANDAELKGFHNTAHAMRQVLYDMLSTGPNRQIYCDADRGAERASVHQS